MSVGGIIACIIIGLLWGLALFCVIWVEGETNGLPKEHDKIHDKEKVMNKREKIKKLEEEVKELKEQQEYVLHKDDKPIIVRNLVDYDLFTRTQINDISIKYPNHFTHKLQLVEIGEFAITDEKTIEILKDTPFKLFVSIQGIYYVVKKEDGAIHKVSDDEIEILHELMKPARKPRKKTSKI